jgi:hypothetical protein
MLNKYDRKNNIIKVYIVFLDLVEKKIIISFTTIINIDKESSISRFPP